MAASTSLPTGFSRRTVLVGALAGGAALALPLGGPARAAPLPGEGVAAFRIIRADKDIGTHKMAFERLGDGGERVRTVIDIEVKVFGFSAYRYTHRAEEVWRDGRLELLDTSTERSNGPDKQVHAERRGGALAVTGSGGEHTLDGEVLTTSLWHRDTPKQSRLLGIEDGTLKSVEGRFVEAARVATPEGELDARRYAVRGEFSRDLWYGGDGRLLRVEFTTDRDGSRIVLEPERLPG
ncbi:hypothetical protein SAMN05216241_1248 [Limimonas halophila]|uniref:DUF3108 domain-containing protein n=1 Tax=Limimonas halophila TaxID=1082479 RepID=A0A1G7V9P7_9PROT|nr:DUF6134 family protein [Limimonas halophila]SDG56298.1 hypothetical protein SAMN05216241_1248 [Limimonas halophila]